MRYTKAALAGRSTQQYDFDMAAKGWAFLDAPRLKRRLEVLEAYAKQLKADDPRHDTVASIREATAQ